VKESELMEDKVDLIAALDADTREEALDRARVIGDCEWVKVGKQLFTRCGPDIVLELQEMGKKVFLDQKFHDIPNTVARAARAAADLGARLITVHACGGRRMIEAARNAVADSETKIVAVTVLTSLSDEMLRDEVGLHETAAQAVPRYARLAVDSGAHGVVCSPQEIVLVRKAIGLKALVVTPGVRPEWAAADDQARFMTPAQARAQGASAIVVGRPIFGHEHPAEAVRLILDELHSR
jgi:orotidine-5'-phosphate decarboxylase